MRAGIASATLTATLGYTAATDPDDGTDAIWEPTVADGHDFNLEVGVTYNGSPSGVSAVYSFDRSGNRFNSRAALSSGQHMENIPAGNPTGQSAAFDVIFRANTDNRQESFDGDIAVFRLYANQVATQADVDELFAATGIPEPSTLALTLLSGLPILRRRR